MGDPTAEAIAWFDEEAATYRRRYAEPSERLDDFLRELPPRSRILDVGCGPGVDADAVARRGHRVVAIDAAPGMAAAVRREFPQVDARVADMRSLDLDPGSFEGILALYSLIFLPKGDVPHVLSTFERLLSPHGVLLVAMQGGRSREMGEGSFFSLWTMDETTAALRGAGFDIVRTWDRPPKAGEMQHPKLHVLARKRPPAA